MSEQTDQTTFDGYTALPDSGTGPGILLLHAWWGLNEYFRELADRLAAEGFLVVAPDLFGDGVVLSTPDEAEARLKNTDWNTMVPRMEAAFTHLMAHPARSGQKIGAVGFSLGGSWAIAAASQQPDEIAAVVVYYGAGEADYTVARAAYQGHFAVGDPFESDEYVPQMENEMRAAGREVEIHHYDGIGHWFAEHNRPDVYNAAAAELAWERTLHFLKARLF